MSSFNSTGNGGMQAINPNFDSYEPYRPLVRLSWYTNSFQQDTIYTICMYIHYTYIHTSKIKKGKSSTGNGGQNGSHLY